MNIDFSFSDEGRVGQVKLSSPETGNRLGTDDLQRLGAGLEELAAARPAAIVLAGAGEDFCLGRDPGGDSDPAAARRSLTAVIETGERIRALPTLVLVALRGRARGLGAGLALHADLAIASEGASLAFDEVERGFPPTLVMTYAELYLPRKLAREMIATGRPLDATEALGLGLVNSVVPAAELDAAVAELSAELASRDAAALTACKPFLAEMESLPQHLRAARGIAAGVDFFSRAHGGGAPHTDDSSAVRKETR